MCSKSLITKFAPLIFLTVIVGLFMVSCETKSNNSNTREIESAEPIAWEYIENHMAFDDAILHMMLPYDEDRLYQQAEFVFEAVNFKFNQSIDNEKLPFKSYQGSFIQLLLNGKPYGPIRGGEQSFPLGEGHYVALAFLCNDKGMISRSPESYVLRQFSMGDKNYELTDLTDPMIFYHLPEGKYEEGQNILLDFFLANTSLNEKAGHRVKVTINDQSWVLDRWQPLSISDLRTGNYQIQLQIINEAGEPIPGRYSTASGQFTIEKAKKPI